ncbi:MAG: sulfatase-like hydrolase/transferase, partial [Candidatus Aminicenantes bacterium]
FKTELREHRHWKTIALYDKEIRYTDEHIKKLYDYLKEKGISKRMVTCITADHGEEFGEHGTANGHADFYSEDTFVPLIFHGYGIPGNKVIDEYISTMDIPVTLLGMANLAFDQHIEGIDLLEAYKKPGAHKNRKMLIIGNGRYTRSLQMLAYPWSFILNFDHHYEYWYIDHRPDLPIPADSFKTVSKGWIKTKKNTMTVPLPYVMKEGLSYIIFQANIPKNKGFQVQIKMIPYSLTQKIKISPNVNTLTVIYPAAVQDRIIVLFELQSGTIIDTDHLKYAFISKEEFPVELNSLEKIENEVYEKFPTLRKNKQKDEWFDLSADIYMKNDLIEVKQFKPQIVEYHKMTYTAYKYYFQKRKKLLKGTMTKENLTEKEKNMLKTLGYL